MTALPAISLSDHAEARLHEPCVLLKLGEIVLKGKNRQQFEKLLQNNIRLAAADLGIGLRLWQRNGVIVLSPAVAAGVPVDGEAAQTAADLIADRMLDVMGVVRVCRAVRVAKQAQAAIDMAAELAGGRPGTFAVRARRRRNSSGYPTSRRVRGGRRSSSAWRSCSSSA